MSKRITILLTVALLVTVAETAEIVKRFGELSLKGVERPVLGFRLRARTAASAAPEHPD